MPKDLGVDVNIGKLKSLKEMEKAHGKIVNELYSLDKYKRIGLVRVKIQYLLKDKKYLELLIGRSKNWTEEEQSQMPK